jgi:hypothetical protein
MTLTLPALGPSSPVLANSSVMPDAMVGDNPELNVVLSLTTHNYGGLHSVHDAMATLLLTVMFLAALGLVSILDIYVRVPKGGVSSDQLVALQQPVLFRQSTVSRRHAQDMCCSISVSR